MTIYATGDLHGEFPLVPDDCETLFINGDFAWCACTFESEKVDRIKSLKWFEEQGIPWLESLRKRNIEVIATLGNHDHLEEKDVKDAPWTLLVDNTIQWKNKTVCAIPWIVDYINSPRIHLWDWTVDEKTYMEKINTIKEADIILSHLPIEGIFSLTTDFLEAGSPHLKELILKIKPEIVFTGHVHHQGGHKTQLGRTTVYSTATNYGVRPVCYKIKELQ